MKFIDGIREKNPNMRITIDYTGDMNDNNPQSASSDVSDIMNYLVPSVTYDGIFFVNKGIRTELHFAQTRVKDGSIVKRMDSVASVSFDSVQDMKDLVAALQVKIRELENPEP